MDRARHDAAETPGARLSAGAGPAADPRVPVTLLTGFLGAGKTTLLNRLLSEEHGLRCAVVVNEYGDVGVDGSLVVGSRDELVELANGCLCCTVRGDLLDTLVHLVKRRRKLLGGTRFDRILVEASGLASPGPACDTLRLPELLPVVRQDAVVTLVHAAEIARQVQEHPEAGEQLAYADRVVLNHLDRCDDAARAAAEEVVRRCAPDAPCFHAVRADVPLTELLDVERGDPDAAPGDAPGAAPGEHVHVAHTSGVESFALEADAPLDFQKLKMWLGFLGQRRGQDLMRAKGFVHCVDRDDAVLVQVVSRWLEVGPVAGREPPPRSTLVLIGRHLDRDEIERGWLACRADA